MAVDEVLFRMGGVASHRRLVERCGRGALASAVDSGMVRRLARGRYALPAVDEATAAAYGLGGVVCLESAALAWGWAVKAVPTKPHVRVPRGRRLSPERARLVHLHRFDLLPEEVDGLVTDVETTLRTCLRSLPFDAALAVADSALREGVDPAVLRRVATTAQGAGAARIRRVAAAADGRAANPFESTLRAIALGVPGLRLTPQLPIAGPGWWCQPDLVDERLRIVAEADSFEWHGKRAALKRDCRRYDELVADDWRVLRFAWEHVMHEPAWVRSILIATVARAQRHTEVPRSRAEAA